jgi:hypothetical protein
MNERNLPEHGRKSPKFGHLGVWTFSLGPNSPIPGERLMLGIIDSEGNIVRRFEQIRGACIDPGYVDFFNSYRCRPSVHEMPLVDIDNEGKVTVLLQHHSQEMGMGIYLSVLEAWATRHGKPEWAL